MKRLIARSLLVVLCLGVLPLCAADNPYDSLCDRGEYLLLNRHLDSGFLDSAEHVLRAVRDSDPGNARSLGLLARVYFQMGGNAATRSEQLAWYRRGQAAADSLCRLDDRNPDGPMWWAANRGRAGELQGIMSSLFMVPSLEKSWRRCIELGMDYGDAYAALGGLYRELPAFAGGSYRKSREILNTGLKEFPNCTAIRLELLDLDLKEGRSDSARRDIDAILSTDHPDNPGDYAIDHRPEAERAQRRLDVR